MTTKESNCSIRKEDVVYIQYKDETQLSLVMDLIDNELSEPYSIFTYRYFVSQWPDLCFLANDPQTGRCFGCIIGKMDIHRQRCMRGYIGMLVVEKSYRHLGVGTELVRRVVLEMLAKGCEEVALEAEVTNKAALRLYENLGFIRDKRLQRYYLNGSDAFRLKLLAPNAQKETDVEPSTISTNEAACQLQKLSVESIAER